jgi:hypothetical protein
MSVYTVHAPPPQAAEAAPDPERFVFVRDGFHFWAFVFGPLWLIAKRLWLVLLAYIVLVIVAQAGLWALRVPPAGQSVFSVMLHLLIALEASTLQRWTLARRRWTQIGVVSGNDQEAAERRFFDSWVRRDAGRSGPAAPPPARMAPPSSDIVGLFPEPQARQ